MSVTEMSQKGLLEEHRFIIIVIQENPLNMVIKKKLLPNKHSRC